MRLLFLNYISNGPGFNSGIAALSAFLKKNDKEVLLLNVTTQSKISDVQNEIMRIKPDIIGFNIHTPHWRLISNHISKIKEITDAFIICGGYHPTLCPDEVISHPDVNCICRGEGERPLLKLINCLEKGASYHTIQGLWVKKKSFFGQKIFKNSICQPESLEDLPFWDRELFIDSGMTTNEFSLTHIGGFPLSSGRGCPYNCYFCNNASILKMYSGDGHKTKYVRKMSVDRVLSECRFLMKKYNAQKFEFWDEMFASDKKWVAEFCEKYTKDIAKPFMCALRVEKADEQMSSMLKKAGCQSIFMGVEVGNETYRKTMLNRKMSNESIERSFQYAKDAGLERFAWVMLGLPDETSSMVEETISFLLKIKPDMIGWSLFHALPMTYLFDYCQKKGYLDEMEVIFPYQGAPDYEVPVLKQPSISIDEINGLCEKFRKLEQEGFVVNK